MDDVKYCRDCKHFNTCYFIHYIAEKRELYLFFGCLENFLLSPFATTCEHYDFQRIERSK
jgi:hypothetical protein